MTREVEMLVFAFLLVAAILFALDGIMSRSLVAIGLAFMAAAFALGAR